MPDCFRVYLCAKDRKDIVPDPVSRIIIFSVCGILLPADLFSVQVLLNLLSGECQKRSDPFPPDRMDSAQTFQSRTSGKIQENGLRVVIPVMGRRDLQIGRAHV